MTQSAVIFGCEGPRLTSAEAKFYGMAQPLGFILFQRNLEEVDQIRALCADLRSAVGWDAPIFIDQEGGRVQRMRAPMVRDWLPPLDEVARAGNKAAQVMQLRSQIIACELRALGIDGNCVPTLDIARPDTHPVLRNRCYGEVAASVIEIGKAVIAGQTAGGVISVIKHMPGHGLGTLDSHLDLPRVAASRAALEAQDFAVFQAFADHPFGMSAHLVFEQIDPRPATISPVMIDLVRNHIGFGGLLMTDDISMQALSGTVAERGQAALQAGCDVVLHCNGALPEMQALFAALPPMSDQSLGRATQALASRPAAVDVDIAALAAEFAALTEQA